jgi:hypothetical protein
MLGTKWDVPIYATRGALIHPLLMVIVIVGGLAAGGEYPALAAGFDVTIVLGVVTHEVAHAIMARRSGQTVGSARVGFWRASVVWGTPGEAITPRDLARIAAAGPLTNLVIAGLTFIAAVATHGNVRAFFAVQSLLNCVTFATNAAPIRARKKPGQRRIGTDGAIVVRAARAARLGPKHIDMLAPNTPDADPSPHTID